jgi:Periplasmic protease
VRKVLATVVIIIILAGGSFAAYRFATNRSLAAETKTPEEKDVYVHFVMEGFDTIKKEYWNALTESDLAGHFDLSIKRALENAGIEPVVTAEPVMNRDAAARSVAAALATATSTEGRKALSLGILNVALYNLQPIGRNGLLSQTQESAFREGVANVDESKDLYHDLGLEKGASDEDVRVAYEKKSAELKKEGTAEAKAELEKIAYASDVLTDPVTKDIYNAGKIEPTAQTDIFGTTLYIKMDRIAPTTLLEFVRRVDGASTTPKLDSMVIDLRGNLGGALDFANGFLGLFLGQNQFAYDFYHQGNYEAQRTTQPKFPELSRYKEVVLLTNNMTQSTAEVTAAAFKRFKLGTVVGTATRGWGTVENTFPLETQIDPKESYLMLLVHSITLRDDNEPVEGRGVDPDVSIDDASWKALLANRLKTPGLAKTVQSLVLNPPK